MTDESADDRTRFQDLGKVELKVFLDPIVLHRALRAPAG
jgi:hypothetical protein